MSPTAQKSGDKKSVRKNTKMHKNGTFICKCHFFCVILQRKIIISLPRRALRLVYEWLDLHQDELLANWERLGKSEAPMKITPLQ